MPLLQTSGNVTADGYGGGVAAVPQYIEDVFQTWLYQGNGSTQTITNGIDLSTKGGLVWYKDRTTAYEHQLVDTVRGAGYNLETPNTSAQASRPTALTAFTSTGFTLGSNVAANGSGDNFVSWTFRKQPKFFDVVTYTGNGSASQTISHSLGSTPGCVIIKSTSSGNWNVWAKDDIYYQFGLYLNSSAAGGGRADFSADITSTTLDVGSAHMGQTSNTNSVGYVAYLFASNAGGFGLTGTDNVITCSVYTGNGSATGPTVTLGYEPQWLLIKNADSAGNWQIIDNMRGMTVGSADALLQANLSNAESSADYVSPTATGFQITSTSTEVNRNGYTYIYIAIRRGPMKVPTSGTSVFAPALASSSGTFTATSNFPVDWAITGDRSGSSKFYAGARLIGNGTLQPNTTGQETSQSWGFDNMTGFTLPGVVGNYSGFIDWIFRRAPNFFDAVCYTGTGAGQTVNHNLGVIPELLILKNRSSVSDWPVKCPVGLTDTGVVYLNSDTFNSTGVWQAGDTSTTFKTRSTSNLYYNQSGQNYVAYLFASCPGVSKVGSYTGNGSTQTINCGFTGGARFVLIKRTDSTGDWYVYDTVRGMTVLTDPYLLLNSTAAESATLGSVTTVSTGFAVNASILAAININGASYIYISIA